MCWSIAAVLGIVDTASFSGAHRATALIGYRLGFLMQILIVESQTGLGEIWKQHLERHGMDVELVLAQDAAVAYLQDHPVDLIVLDLLLDEGSAIAVADYANYKYPKTPVIFVTGSSFFSDGSIFQHMSNARAFLPTDVNPDDLAAMVQHYGSHP